MDKNKSTTKSITELTDLICGYQDMTNRKNELMRKAVKHLRSIKEIAAGLENMSLDESRDTAVQMCKLAGRSLRVLSYIWVDLDDEAELALPEAEQDTTIDALDALDELEELEEDLPFVTPEEKEDE